MKFDMVFEGGGAKGISFLGALAELEARGHAPDRIVGTSAGAIFATLLAAGFDASTLRDAVARRDENGTLLLARFKDLPQAFDEEDLRNSTLMRGFQRIDLPLIPQHIEEQIDQAILRGLLKLSSFRQLFSLVERGGLYVGDAFLEWLIGLLNERQPGLGHASMAEFHAHTGRDLSLVAADVDAKLMLVLNHRTAPRVPIAYAVKMSMCIPMVWQDMTWQAEWGRYLDRDITGHTIGDGGIVSNFPMHLIATSLEEVVEVMGDADPEQVPNLGFLIDESLSDPAFDAPQPDDGLLAGPARRLARLWQALLTSRDQLVVERCLKNHEICRLPAAGYGTTEFDMSPRRFDTLVGAGRAAAARYFDARGV